MRSDRTTLNRRVTSGPRLPTFFDPGPAELTDEEMEPSLEQLASFGGSLKEKGDRIPVLMGRLRTISQFT